MLSKGQFIRDKIILNTLLKTNYFSRGNAQIMKITWSFNYFDNDCRTYENLLFLNSDQLLGHLRLQCFFFCSWGLIKWMELKVVWYEKPPCLSWIRICDCPVKGRRLYTRLRRSDWKLLFFRIFYSLYFLERAFDGGCASLLVELRLPTWHI